MNEIAFQKEAYNRLCWEPGFLPFRFNCGKLRGGHYNAIVWGSERNSTGVSDIGALVDGLFMIWIELKQPGGQLRKSQRHFKETIEAHGGYIWVAETLDDIEAIIKEVREIIA